MTKSIKILIVEDEAINAIAMKIQFELFGYHVCKTAATGDDAIEFAQREKPDVILMDVRLAKKLNGIDAFKEIKKSIKTKTIFITGYENMDTLNEIKKLTPLAILRKPIDFHKIDEIIKNSFHQG